MDLEELRTARERERRTDSLQHLRDDFYQEASEYVRELKRERQRRADEAGDPYTPEAMRLTDEIDSAQETIESLYERRRGKIVTQASFAASGQSVETDGMTDSERSLFDNLVDCLKRNERQILDTTVEGQGPGVPEPSADAARVDAGANASAGPTGGESGANAAPNTAQESARTAAGGGGGQPDSAEPAVPTPGPGEGDAQPEGVGAINPAAADTPESPADTPATAGANDSGSDPGTLAEAMGGTDSVGADTAAGVDSADTVGGPETAPDAGPATGTDQAAGSPSETPTNGASASVGEADSSASQTTASADTAAASDTGTTGSAVGDAPGSGGGPAQPGAGDPATGESSADRPAAEAAAIAGDTTPAADAGGPTTAADTASTNTAGTGPTTTTDDQPTETADAAGTTETGDATAAHEASVDDATADVTDSLERETVLVKQDVGELLGVDERQYELAAGDTVFLPTANAEPLAERDAVERL